MKQNLITHFALVFYTILMTSGFLFFYLSSAPVPEGLVPAVYFWTIGSYYGVGLTLAGLLLIPLSLSRMTGWLIPLLIGLWLAYLLVDAITFNLYRFHVDWLLLEIFIFDFRGLGLPDFLIALGAIAALVGLGLLFGLQMLARHIAARHSRLQFAVFTLMLPVFAVNSVISVWAHQFDREEITQYSAYLPIYFPMTSRSDIKPLTQALPGLFPAVAGKAVQVNAANQGIVRYPAEPMTCRPETRQSILIIALESWQADTLSREIMPNLWAFSQKAKRFERHISSGSTTVPGLFGLFYGLHATYYDLFKSTPKSHPSLLTETVHDLGYRTRVFLSGSLERFAQRSLFFPHVTPADYHQAKTDNAVLEAFLASRKDQATGDAPRFDFVFFTSSHSPYLYPPEFSRFKPLPVIEGGYVLDKTVDALPYKNDYSNSLLYIDSLLGRLLASMQADGTLDNTWIVIVGDHAEEFNESGLGFWGHGSNFSRWQTHTPLIVKAPGKSQPGVVTRTSLHQDIMPTLMVETLGCTNRTEAFSNGLSLFALPEKRATVLSSYFVNAYWVDGVVFEKMTGRKYAWDDISVSRPLPDTAMIKSLIGEETRFITPNDPD